MESSSVNQVNDQPVPTTEPVDEPPKSNRLNSHIIKYPSI
jgi:hypothetical protein